MSDDKETTKEEEKEKKSKLHDIFQAILKEINHEHSCVKRVLNDVNTSSL